MDRLEIRPEQRDSFRLMAQEMFVKYFDINKYNKNNIYKQIIENNIEAVKEIISYDSSMQAFALCIATIEEKLEILNFLFESGANANINSQLWTHDYLYPIAYAVNSQNANLLKILIKNGADVNTHFTVDNYKITPMVLAITSHNCSIVKLLIENGAYINEFYIVGDDKISYFELVVITNEDDITKLFIENGANINIYSEINGLKRTALNFAIETGNLKLVNLLIENGADGNLPQIYKSIVYSPLYLAIMYFHPLIAWNLFFNGATFLSQDDADVFVQHHTSSNNQIEINGMNATMEINDEL
jgi:ankyrin repeat protein